MTQTPEEKKLLEEFEAQFCGEMPKAPSPLPYGWVSIPSPLAEEVKSFLLKTFAPSIRADERKRVGEELRLLLSVGDKYPEQIVKDGRKVIEVSAIEQHLSTLTSKE